MSKCPITWNVPVDTGHHFFFTQESFNKYNTNETYEQKILNRYAQFPLHESHLGVNAQSKRSQKKQAKKQHGDSWKKNKTEAAVGNEDNKSNKRKNLKAKVESLSEESDKDDYFDAVTSDHEEFGVDIKPKPEKKRTKDANGMKQGKEKLITVKNMDSEEPAGSVKTKTNNQSELGGVESDGMFSLETGNGVHVDPRKDVEIHDMQKDVLVNNQSEDLETVHDTHKDLDEFGDTKTETKPGNETSVEKQKIVEITQKKKTLSEEFPWDTKYRERRSEKLDLHKYQNRKSSLTNKEQNRYLALHAKYAFNDTKKLLDKDKTEVKEFSALHERVVEEQKEFQQYLERLAQTMRSEYNYLAPEADRYFKERLAMKKKRVQLYSKFYNVLDKLNLSTIGPPCQLLFVMSLLEMGTVPKMVIPNMSVGERPKIPVDYDSITKHYPCVHSKSTHTWNNEPCSQDQNCDILSQRYKVHITISASAIACLVNNHAPNYSREWEIPFTVRDYQLQDGEKKFMHRVVYIDNALPPKEVTGRDKNTMFYKYALRSHMARLNQVGHLFAMNPKSDPHYQEALNVSKQNHPSHTTHNLAHTTEKEVPFLSPIKSPKVQVEMKKTHCKELKEKTIEKYDAADPFESMEISMEDLETFGTDQCKNTKSKNDPGIKQTLSGDSGGSEKFFNSNSADLPTSEITTKNVVQVFKGDNAKTGTTDYTFIKDCLLKTEISLDGNSLNKSHDQCEINVHEGGICTVPLSVKETIIPNVTMSDTKHKEEIIQSSDVEKDDERKDLTVVSENKESQKTKGGNSDKSLLDLQTSSASDDESDALVIDEPDELPSVIDADSMETKDGGQAQQFFVKSPSLSGSCQQLKHSFDMETPQSPVMMDAPASPELETPASPTSPSKKIHKLSGCLGNSVTEIMSPERADRSSPTSPDQKLNSTGQPCKIIPLQRDSEEENIIDNSNVVVHQSCFSSTPKTARGFGLRPKRKTTHVSDSDSDSSYKIPVFENSVNLYSSGSKRNNDSCRQSTMDKIDGDSSLKIGEEYNNSSNTDKICNSSVEIVDNDSDDSDEILSPCSKLLGRSKAGKIDQSDSFVLSPRRRCRVIDSDSDDEQNAASDLTESESTMDEKLSTLKTACSKSTDNKNTSICSNKKSIFRPGRKRQKSSQSLTIFESVENSDAGFKSENTEEIACVRRKTRSSIGTKKKSEVSESIECSQLQKSTSLDENMLSDVSAETVAMPARRQTRRSLDTTASDVEQDKKQRKLALLDRVKKSLRPSSCDDKEPVNESVGQQKRKRGRPPKVKVLQVSTSSTKGDSLNSSIEKKINTETEDKKVEDSMFAESVQDNTAIDGNIKNNLNNVSTTENVTCTKHANQNTTTERVADITVQHKKDFTNDKPKTEKEGSTTSLKELVTSSEVMKKVACSEEGVKIVAPVTKDSNKDKKTPSLEKVQLQKTDIVKKPKQSATQKVPKATAQKTQPSVSSVNPLENILQAQEKLLDNPKHHRDQAHMEYLSQFKFPERHNITYHLWSLGAYNVMIRCRYHGVYKDPNQKVSFVHVSPKMEYQVNHGLEQVTTSEISKEWVSAYVRPNCKIIRARINPLQSDIVSMKEEELNKLQTAAHGFNPTNGFQMLANVFHRLHQCSPGQYLLSHSPGSSECQIKKSTDNNKRGTYDLHMNYFGFMGGEKESHHVPWIPIDTNYIQQRFHKKGRIPATFEPRDYKQGMKNRKKKKKGKH